MSMIFITLIDVRFLKTNKMKSLPLKSLCGDNIHRFS